MSEDNINYYEIMYNLKLLKNESLYIKTNAEWEIFISKFLKYIFSIKILRDIYVKSVNEYLSKNANRFTTNFFTKFIIPAEIETTKNNHSTILYFEPTNTKQCVIKSGEMFNIYDLYFHIFDLPFDLDFYTTYQVEIENIDCFVLTFLNNNYLLFDEKIEFSRLYLKSLVNGVYNKMRGHTILEISKVYYSGELPTEQHANEVISPHLLLTNKETEIFNLVNDESTVADIGKKVHDYSKQYTTTSKHLKNIARKLGYEKGALKSIQRYKRNP